MVREAKQLFLPVQIQSMAYKEVQMEMYSVYHNYLPISEYTYTAKP